MRPADLLITGVDLVDAARRTPAGWLHVHDSTIAALGAGRPPHVPAGTMRIEAAGGVLTPGLIDVHAHGGGGAGFDGGPDAIAAALAATARHGVTRSMLSLVTDEVDVLAGQLSRIASVASTTDPAAADRRGAAILGVHLEGPFLGNGHPGAHDPRWFRNPEAGPVAALIEAGAGILRYVTIAPELPGATAAVERFVSRGIRVGVGHTDADYEQSVRAFAAGASVLTHTFNGMPGIHHRSPGPIVAALEDESVTLELIVDGVHVSGPMVRRIVDWADGRIALITDALAAADGPDGAYRLGRFDLDVVGGVARVRGTETIAGSTTTLDASVRLAVELGFGFEEAIGMATDVPARAFGLDDHLGRLSVGMTADLVLWDGALNVDRVWRAGRELSARPSARRPVHGG